MLFRKHKTAHFSVDDTIWLFENLGHFGYRSIFEQPTLAFFRKLHEEFGLKTSFYCFGSFQGLNLSDMTGAYRDEFLANSDWLRFGFHAGTDGSRYTQAAQAAEDYLSVRDDLIRIVGENSVTDFCRLHCFSGSKAAIKGMRKCGLRGLLCADDNRSNYYLSDTKNRRLNLKGSYYDWSMPMMFLKTDLRVETGEEAAFRDLITDKRHIEAFTHEWALNEENKHKIEVLCRRLHTLGYEWAFCDGR